MNEITMKVKADKLIMQALEEDITSEDITTNAVMRERKAGEVALMCKQDGVIAGLKVFERVFTLLDPHTIAEFYVEDGEFVSRSQILGIVKGDMRVLVSELFTENEWNCHLYQKDGRSSERNEDEASGYP